MQLIGYLRVSSEGQVDGYGLAAQQEAIERWARSHGHDLSRLVFDAGVSGTIDAVMRPGLSEVLTAIAQRQADGLVVARLDRLARALTVQEATLAIVWRSGAHAFSAETGEVLADDPDDPMRTALRQVVGVFAELDRRMVVKRLKDGRTAKAALGQKAVGAYAYGYRGEGRGRQRTEVPDQTEAEIVQIIIALRSDGSSYRQIAEHLNGSGIPPRRATRWWPMTVRSVVLRHAPDLAGLTARNP